MRRILMLGLVWLCFAQLSARAAEPDQDAVRRLLMQTFDKPGDPLSVAPIVVDRDIAIAGWSQGELGGRALLRKKAGAWTIDLCAGDALKQSATLEKLGLSKPHAEAMAQQIAREEQKLDPKLLERFSRFDGMFGVDAAGGHSAIDPHHRAIP